MNVMLPASPNFFAESERVSAVNKKLRSGRFQNDPHAPSMRSFFSWQPRDPQHSPPGGLSLLDTLEGLSLLGRSEKTRSWKEWTRKAAPYFGSSVAYAATDFLLLNGPATSGALKQRLIEKG